MEHSLLGYNWTVFALVVSRDIQKTPRNLGPFTILPTKVTTISNGIFLSYLHPHSNSAVWNSEQPENQVKKMNGIKIWTGLKMMMRSDKNNLRKTGESFFIPFYVTATA